MPATPRPRPASSGGGFEVRYWSPCNAVLGFSELLSMGAEEREWTGLILKAGRHLLALLNDVLDISHIEGGNLPVSMEPVPVAALIADVLDLVRPLAEAAGVHPGTRTGAAGRAGAWPPTGKDCAKC